MITGVEQHEKLGALVAVDALLDVTSDDSLSILSHYIHGALKTGKVYQRGCKIKRMEYLQKTNF